MSARRHRLFVALDIPEDVRRSLHGISLWLRNDDEAIRPVPVERMHATLHFIGDTSAAALEMLAPALFDGMRGSSIQSSISRIVARPRAGAARLIAGEYGDSDGVIARLAEQIEGIVATSVGGRRAPAPFWPHITIARISRPTRVRRFPTSHGEHVFAFDRITLYDSYITSDGPPRYQPLMTVPLDSHGERKFQHG